MGDTAIDSYHCYVGCLHHSIGDEEFLTLAKCFSTNVVSSKVGVVTAQVVWSLASDFHRGYGFIQYTDGSAADQAILLMQGVYAKGLPLVVKSTSHFVSSYDDEESILVNNTTVHISNLTDQDTQADIEELARPFGEFDNVHMVTDRVGRAHAQRYCFVNFKRREFALAFLCHMDNWNTGRSVGAADSQTISCFWALHSNEYTAYDRKLVDKEREDEVFGLKYASDLLPKKM